MRCGSKTPESVHETELTIRSPRPPPPFPCSHSLWLFVYLSKNRTVYGTRVLIAVEIAKWKRCVSVAMRLIIVHLLSFLRL